MRKRYSIETRNSILLRKHSEGELQRLKEIHHPSQHSVSQYLQDQQLNVTEGAITMAIGAIGRGSVHVRVG